MISEIRTLLRDAPGTPFALVEGTLAMAQLADRPAAMPAAYVFPLRTASSENRNMNRVIQRTAEDVGVLIIFENLAEPLGDPAADELEALYGWVRERLVGVVLSEKNEPLIHVTGELVKARGGVVWWQETFGTAHFQVEKTT